jgi:hypothetical protein
MSAPTQYRRRHEGRLRYHPNIGRWVLDGWELHCGDCFEVRVGDKWVPTRMEHGAGWYLTNGGDLLDGLDGRSHE